MIPSLSSLHERRVAIVCLDRQFGNRLSDRLGDSIGMAKMLRAARTAVIREVRQHPIANLAKAVALAARLGGEGQRKASSDVSIVV